MKKFSSVVLGLAAMALSATAANYTLTPAEGWPGPELSSVTLSFDAPVTDVIDVTTTANTGKCTVTYVSANSTQSTNVSKGMELKGDGNNLNMTFTRGTKKVGVAKPFSSMSGSGYPAIMEGDMTFTIAAGVFNVGGVPNEEITFTYYMSLESPAPDFSYELSLAEGWQSQIGKTITLTFKNDVVATNNNLQIYCNTAGNGSSIPAGYYTFDTEYTSNICKTASGNVLTLSTGKSAHKENTSGTFKTASPKMLAGDFIITVPAGSYTVNGVEGPEIKLSYYLSNTEPVFNFTPTFTPEANSSVEEVGTIEADFGTGANVAWAADAASKISLYKIDGAVQNCNVTYTLSASGTKLTLVPDKKMTEVNKYELTIGAGAMTNNGKPNTEDIKVIYTIDTPPLPDAQDFPYTVNPLTDSWYTILKQVALTFDTDKEIELFNNNKGNVYVTFEGMNADYNGTDPSKCYWFANDKVSEGNNTRVEGKTAYFVSTTGVEQGKATLYDTAGDFKGGYVNIVIREATLLIGGVPNKEITLRYWVSAAAPDFESADITPDPTKDEITSLDKVTIDYWAAKKVEKTADALTATLTVDGEASDATVTAALDGSKVTVTIDPAQTAYADYVVTIPAGLYTIDGLYNNEISLKYSIVKPKVYNYEPVYTPAADSYVDELGVIIADFGSEAAVEWAEDAATMVTLVKTGEEPAACDVVYTLTADGTVLTLTPDKTITEKGAYELTIKAGAMINNGQANPEDIKATFNVGEPAPSTDFIPNEPSDLVCYIHQCSERKNEDGQEYLKVEDYGFIKFILNLGYTANGKDREYAVSNMSYRILIDEMETPYIFQYIPEVLGDNGEVISNAHFPMLKDEEPMEWVPATYTNWEFPVQQTDHLYQCYLYGIDLEKVERVGVQSRGLWSEEYYPSEIAWVKPTLDPREDTGAVNTITDDSVNASVEYFDLQGCKVDASAKGLLIKRTVSGNGQVTVKKILK